MTRPTALILLAGIALSVQPARAGIGEVELESRFWADPQLSSARVRVDATEGGRASVRVTAATREAVERAKILLADEPGVESFQVDFDPRLRRPDERAPGKPELGRAKAALQADPGTRLHAGLLDRARFDAQGALLLPEPPGLAPADRRRLARLLLTQPGIAALRFNADPSPASATTDGPPSASGSPPPTRTRLQLDPLQPEAAAIARDEPRQRTLLHAEVPAPLPDAPASLDPPAEAPSEEPSPTAPRVATAPTTPAEATPATEEPGAPRAASVDRAIEDFLARALELEGAPKTLKARVSSGVVVFGGEVRTRELAIRLRELARNFDGVTRVTGGLRVESTGEQVSMDALPD